MLLDCRDLSKTFVPLDPRELRVVVANSMVKHELSGGEYAQRRTQCEEAVRFFRTGNNAITSLRDVKMPTSKRRGQSWADVVFRRVRHVVSEITRTTQVAGLLAQKHYDQAGALMVQSHQSLRDDYEVSTTELDFLQAEAMKVRRRLRLKNDRRRVRRLHRRAGATPGGRATGQASQANVRRAI